MTPNIGKPLRTSYIAIGLVLLLLPLVMPSLDSWIRITAAIVGIMGLVALVLLSKHARLA